MEEKEIIRRIKIIYQDLEGVLANMRLLKRSGISPELQHILNEHIGLIDTDNHMLVRMIEDMERHQEQDSDTPNICQWNERPFNSHLLLHSIKSDQNNE